MHCHGTEQTIQISSSEALKTLAIPRMIVTLFLLHKYLKDFESSQFVIDLPSYKVSWHFVFSGLASQAPSVDCTVVHRCSEADLFGKFLMYLVSLKVSSTPLTRLELTKNPEKLQTKSA